VPEIVKWETDSGSKSRIFFCFAWGERVRPQVESGSCFDPLLVISGSTVYLYGCNGRFFVVI